MLRVETRRQTENTKPNLQLMKESVYSHTGPEVVAICNNHEHEYTEKTKVFDIWMGTVVELF